MPGSAAQFLQCCLSAVHTCAGWHPSTEPREGRAPCMANRPSGGCNRDGIVEEAWADVEAPCTDTRRTVPALTSTLSFAAIVPSRQGHAVSASPCRLFIRTVSALVHDPLSPHSVCRLPTFCWGRVIQSQLQWVLLPARSQYLQQVLARRRCCKTCPVQRVVTACFLCSSPSHLHASTVCLAALPPQKVVICWREWQQLQLFCERPLNS